MWVSDDQVPIGYVLFITHTVRFSNKSILLLGNANCKLMVVVTVLGYSACGIVQSIMDGFCIIGLHSAEI